MRAADDRRVVADESLFEMEDKVEKIVYSSHSSMPQNYESTLSNKELEDLVSYLITAATAPHPTEQPSKRRGKGNDGN